MGMNGVTPNEIQVGADKQETTGAINETKASVDKTNETIRGLTDNVADLKSMFEQLKNSLNTLQTNLLNQLINGDEDLKKAQEAAVEALCESYGESSETDDDKFGSKPMPTKSDLMKLSGKWTLGPLLIFNELRAIHDDLQKMMPGGKGVKKPKELESESGGKDFKIGKIKGVPDMAKAMKDFALGMLVMKIVNKKMVEGAIDIMAYAVTKWNNLSNDMKNNDKRWNDLNGLISIMGKGIKEMVLGMLILAISFPIILLAIPSALALVAFLNIIGLAGKASKMSFKGIKNLAFASLLMAAAFGAFAAVMWFIGKFVTPYLPSAIVGLAAISFVIGYTAYLGKMTKAQARNFMMFAGGAIMIGAAYALFGLTMMMIANAGLKFPLVLAGLAVIWYLLNDAQLQGKKVREASGDFLMFAAGMALLGIAYMAFGKAMSILADVGVVGALKAIPGLAIIYFVIQFSKNVAEEIKNCTTDFIIFAAGMVLLGVAYMAFGVAMNILAQLPFGKIPVIAASMAMIFLIIWGTSKIASEIKDNMKNFIMFAVGCIIMAVAYMAFGVAIKVLAGLQPQVLAAIPALIMAIVMLGISVILAKIIENNMQSFLIFAVGCIVMAIAYMAFGLVLGILGSFSGKTLVMAFLAVLLIMGIMVASALIGAVIMNTGAIMYILAFALASAALSVALLLFGAALLLLTKLGEVPIATIGLALANIAITLFGLVTLIPAIAMAMFAMPFLMTIGLMLPIALFPLLTAMKQLTEIGKYGSDKVVMALLSLNLLLQFIKGVGLGIKLLVGAYALKLLAPILGMAISALDEPLKNLAEVGSKYDIKDILTGVAGIMAMVMSVSLMRVKLIKNAIVGSIALMALSPFLKKAVNDMKPPMEALSELGESCNILYILSGILGITATILTFAGLGTIYGLAGIAMATLASVALIGFGSVFKLALDSISGGMEGLNSIGEIAANPNYLFGIAGLWGLLTTLAFLNVPFAKKNAEKLLETAVPFGKSVSIISTAMEEMKGIKEGFGESVEGLIEAFNSRGMLSFILNLNALGAGINLFGRHVSGTNLLKFRLFSMALNNITQSEAAIDKLLQFAQKADSFKEIAVSFESMANSLERIASKDRKVRSIFDTLSKAKTDINVMPDSTPQAIGGTTFDPAVTDIYNIMKDWNQNGVPIKATIDEETLQITPDNVNNKTGAIKVRN